MTENLAKFKVMMNFNYLIEPRRRKMSCKTPGEECYWIPVTSGRATNGDNVHVPMICKRCGNREEVFMTKKEYKMQERIIEREVKFA